MANENTHLLSDEDVPNYSESPVLTKFRLAIGINTPSTNASPPSDLEALRKQSTGIYKSVLAQQRRYLIQYRLIETLYYISILAQLIIGATLASLGPLSKSYPHAITVLGIVNSCLAGVLALLKSQGLPDRFRKDEFEMRKVQDFIEECECRLVVGWAEELQEKDVDDLIKEVFDRYNVARDTAEMNKPSSYAHQVDGNGTGDEAEGNNNGKGKAYGYNRMAIGKPERQSKIVVGSGKGKSLQIS
ncbi:hypothetical protein B7494_g5923 [Chlorociboria aeruginascens]|nr:hypothetical protein B7494_g5923 [Chlorociboria aeruginascens]